jgi:hypothetical protein
MFVQPFATLADCLLPPQNDLQGLQLRANFAELVETHSERTPGHEDLTFTNFLKLFIRFGDVETPGIMTRLQAVLSPGAPGSEVVPAFFQGFHPRFDRWQAGIELQAADAYSWVIIQGKSTANWFLVLQRTIADGKLGWKETKFAYFAKLSPSEQSGRFCIALDDGHRFVDRWTDDLDALQLPNNEGPVVDRRKQPVAAPAYVIPNEADEFNTFGLFCDQ